MVITVTCPACAASFPVDPNKIPERGVSVRCSACANIFRVERPAPEMATPEAPPTDTSTPEVAPETPADEASTPEVAPEAPAGETSTPGSSTPPSEPETAAWPEQGRDEWSEPEVDEWSETDLEASEPFGADTGAEGIGVEPDDGADSTDGSRMGRDDTMPDWAAETEEEISRKDDGGWADGEPEDEPERHNVPEPMGWVDAEPERPEERAEPEQVLPDPIPVQEPEPVAEPESPVQGFTFGKRDPMDKARRLARVLVSDMVMYNSERHQQALANGTLAEDFEEEIEKSWKEFVDQVGPEIADGEGRRFWSQALNDILAKGASVF